ncbi:MAG: phosphatase PAP2 family protein [Planctomycetota bacterium]|nr:phosphatase PAP2 family protein [Planctomycetota bacterium]
MTNTFFGQPIVEPTFGDEYNEPATECPTFSEQFCAKAARGWCDIKCDYRHYYTCRTGRDLLLCVGAAAIMANTSIDQDFQDWVQDDVRSSDSDDFATFWKTFGEGRIFVPAWVGLALVGSVLDEYPVMGSVGEFGYRTTRSYLVGVPPMVFMQYCLGASRPGEGDGSEWHPFSDDNGVSGHVFMGAVPFITAAQMSENRYMKGCFYFMSTLTAWSRVNDNSHYLSQAWMGWWMAYLSCRSVSETEQGKQSCCTIAPMMAPGTVGMVMEYRR